MSEVIPDHSPGSIYPEWLWTLEKKYNIVDVFNFSRYDYQFDHLEQRLIKVKKATFDANDRIVVVHFDTDYYIQNSVGMNLTNLFLLWQKLDIPLHTMLLYTNHFGITKEIDTICQHSELIDRPTVIETFVNGLSYESATYQTEPDLEIDQIEYHGLALMGAPRSHRYAMYNHLKHLCDKLAMVIRAPS